MESPCLMMLLGCCRCIAAVLWLIRRQGLLSFQSEKSGRDGLKRESVMMSAEALKRQNFKELSLGKGVVVTVN